MNIVVVGGGTAGWLSALMISKVYKGIHNVTLIESKSIGTIGVGEGSTGFLRGVINNELWDYGCNELEFMKQAKSTPKLGILFKEWTELGKEYMEPIDTPVLNNILGSNPLLTFFKANNLDISLASTDGRLISHKLSGFINKDGNVVGDGKHAHHFDSKAAADYLEKVCSNHVEKIIDEIVEINLNEFGYVASLNLATGRVVTGDFFIDASGFSRIFAKKLEVNFLEYEELTLNSAIPFRLEYDYFDEPFFYTVSWAQKYGWMWMIPRSDSVGCGYIYDNRYITEEQAKKEVEEKLGVEINVVKNIKFTAGRLETAWNKNVLSVGLSSNFLEPLEATSIHGTIAQLNNFIYLYLKSSFEETVTEENQNIYNKTTAKMIDNFKDFILLHYAGVRNDTEFWKSMNEKALNNPSIKKILDISKSRLLSFGDIDAPYGSAGYELFNWVLCALDHFSTDTAKAELEKLNKQQRAQSDEFEMLKYITSNNWMTNAEFLKFIRN